MANHGSGESLQRGRRVTRRLVLAVCAREWVSQGPAPKAFQHPAEPGTTGRRARRWMWHVGSSRKIEWVAACYEGYLLSHAHNGKLWFAKALLFTVSVDNPVDAFSRMRVGPAKYDHFVRLISL